MCPTFGKTSRVQAKTHAHYFCCFGIVTSESLGKNKSSELCLRATWPFQLYLTSTLSTGPKWNEFAWEYHCWQHHFILRSVTRHIANHSSDLCFVWKGCVWSAGQLCYIGPHLYSRQVGEGMKLANAVTDLGRELQMTTENNSMVDCQHRKRKKNV